HRLQVERVSRLRPVDGDLCQGPASLDLHAAHDGYLNVDTMCYSDDARPPLPPVVGGAASDHGDLHLTADDGNRFMAYAARAAEPTGAGMVVMPDVRGLHPFYKELAV